MEFQITSIYTPGGAFAFMMIVLSLTLVAIIVYLLVFTGADVPIQIGMY
ncbi:hypothetical protein [Halostagnicola larsenii]|nr:hypothetical protein [Halostagnicola larsenii]